MAFGVIGAFAHQRVTLGTEIALDINITGNPDYAYIEGLLEGFYTNWNDPTLEVRGAARRLIANVPFTVKALKGSEEPLTRAGLFSVVPAAPVITHPGKQKFIRGIENEFIVNISNSPSKVRAVGPWVGVRSDSHPDGVRVSGIVPEVSHAIPDADQKIRLTAESGALMDEVEIDFDLISRVIYTCNYTNTDTTFYRVQLNESDKSVSSDLRFSINRRWTWGMTADDTYIYINNSHGFTSVLYRVPINTGDQETADFEKINNVNLKGYPAVDGDSLYLLSNTTGNRTIKVVNKSNASTIKSFRINVNVGCRGIAIDGDDLIVLVSDNNTSGHKLRWYNKNTANGRTATHTREVSLPNKYLGYFDIAVFNNQIFITPGGNTIRTIDIETGNFIATYTAPSSFQTLRGIAIALS